MSLNFKLNRVPIVVTAARITIEINDAIRPYSIAVAPDSSRRKRLNWDMMFSLSDLVLKHLARSKDRTHPPVTMGSIFALSV